MTDGEIMRNSAEMRTPDPKKVAFISCTNNDMWYDECALYLRHVEIPDGMTAELIPVRGASSMTAGYQAAMEASDAKYKIYLHQDTLLVNKHVVRDLLSFFADSRIGIVGVIGARALPASGIWWDGLRNYGRVLHACEAESIVDSRLREPVGSYVPVECVDGLFMATQYDVPWRTDLFTGWHFYDISACKEFARRGYKTIVPNQSAGFWCIHCPAEKPLDPKYQIYREIFLREYGAELHPDV